MLYDMNSKPEYEANIVAAEILMDSDEVLRYIYEYGYTAEQIASAMSTDINLVALKVAHLATLGYNLHALEHKSNIIICSMNIFSFDELQYNVTSLHLHFQKYALQDFLKV